jgi:hypothetical protein
MIATSSDTGLPSGPSDDELTALALAADPDTTLDDDAVCLWDLNGTRPGRALPEWYMPAPMGGPRPLQGWRRQIVVPIIASFLAITAFGLCNTYGQLGFG